MVIALAIPCFTSARGNEDAPVAMCVTASPKGRSHSRSLIGNLKRFHASELVTTAAVIAIFSKLGHV
jgi:hypothetical protein